MNDRLEKDIAHELKDHLKRGEDPVDLARTVIRIVEEEVTARHLLRLSALLRGNFLHRYDVRDEALYDDF